MNIPKKITHRGSPARCRAQIYKGAKMKGHKIHLIVVLAIVFHLSTASCNQSAALPTATPAPMIQAGDFERQVTVNDQERSYLLHIPAGLTRQQPVPVVFAFHSMDGDAFGMQLKTGFNEIADPGNFLVIYPESLGGWNVGNCCEYAMTENVDEAAFVRVILSDLETIARLDYKRIYAAGHDNGAALAFWLACEMSDTFAAVAIVSGWMPASPCQPEQPVSVIQMHTADDYAIPYAGGEIAYPDEEKFVFPPVEHGIATWVQLNDCRDSVQVEELDYTVTVTRKSYNTCQAGAAVELYTHQSGVVSDVSKSSHEWPSKYVWPASKIIWDFFAAHPKP